MAVNNLCNNKMSKEKIYLLSCGKWLDRRGFIRYFERKVLYTLRKYRMLESAIVVDNKNPKSSVLKYFLNKVSLRNKSKNKMTALSDSTDDIAVKVFEVFMKGKYQELKSLTPKFKKGNQTFVRPFYFMLDKEIELYAKLKNIKMKKIKIDNDVRRWLDDYEQKHLELKNSIVSSLLKIENKI